MGKYLKFYQKYYGKELPSVQSTSYGLCNAFLSEFGSFSQLKIFKPDEKESLGIHHAWWGSGDSHDGKWGEFTPLRQTIVLLLAAMAGELADSPRSRKTTKITKK